MTAGTNTTAQPGRTVSEVRADPSYTALFAKAETAFSMADRATGLQDSFAAFSEGVACLREINAREIARGPR